MNEVAQRLLDHISEHKNARLARIPVELLQAAYKEILSLELRLENTKSRSFYRTPTRKAEDS